MYIWLYIIQTNILRIALSFIELVFYRTITVYLRSFYDVISSHYFRSTVFIINCCYCFKVSHVTLCDCYYVITVIKPKTNHEPIVFECVCLCSERFGVQLSSQLNQTQCCHRRNISSKGKGSCIVADSMTWRWTSQTRYTLWRNTASIKWKIWFVLIYTIDLFWNIFIRLFKI